MKISGDYEKKLYLHFKNNQKSIEKLAQKILKNFYSIPLEKEDLISYCYFELSQPENKIKFYQTNNDVNKLNDYISKKIFSIMFNYCKKYTSKKHQILNNFVSFDDEIEKNSKIKNIDYSYEELFSFLTEEEFFVIYEIYVKKNKRTNIIKNYNLSKNKLNNLEMSARKKISKNYGFFI